MTYTTSGWRCGDCGHTHKSIDAAYQCLRASQKEHDNQDDYFDRFIMRSDGESLTDQEWKAYEAAQKAEYGY